MSIFQNGRQKINENPKIWNISSTVLHKALILKSAFIKLMANMYIVTVRLVFTTFEVLSDVCLLKIYGKNGGFPLA